MDFESYLSGVPRDVQELILYETDPKNLDTLCIINENINRLCINDRIMDQYLKNHQLNIPIFSSLDTRSFLNLKKYMTTTINTNSIILIKVILFRLIDFYGKDKLEDVLLELIQTLTENQNFSDEDIIDILSTLNFNSKDIDYLKYLTYYSFINNRTKVIEWLIENNFYQLDEAFMASIRLNDNSLFNKLLDLILQDEEEKRKVDWFYAVQLAIKYHNVDALESILSIDDNNIFNTLQMSESAFLNWTDQIAHQSKSVQENKNIQEINRIINNYYSKK